MPTSRPSTKKTKPSIVEETSHCRFAPHMILPMARIRRYGHQRQHVCSVLLVCMSTFVQPVLYGRSSFLVCAVRRVHIDGGEIPRRPQPIVVWQRIVHPSVDDRPFVRARIEVYRAIENGPNSIHIFRGRTPVNALRIDSSSRSHASMSFQFFLASVVTSRRNSRIVLPVGETTLNQLSITSRCSLK